MHYTCLLDLSVSNLKHENTENDELQLKQEQEI